MAAVDETAATRAILRDAWSRLPAHVQEVTQRFVFGGDAVDTLPESVRRFVHAALASTSAAQATDVSASADVAVAGRTGDEDAEVSP
ncbi:MAG: hypothetical protein R3C10_04070 [Pirellulales bacterium]